MLLRETNARLKHGVHGDPPRPKLRGSESLSPSGISEALNANATGPLAPNTRRPYVARLLRDYELCGWLGDGLRGQLEAALLAPPKSEYRVAVAPTTS